MGKDEQDKRIDKTRHSLMGSLDGTQADLGILSAKELQEALQKAIDDNAVAEYVSEYRKSRKGK